MQLKVKSGQSLTEPISVADFKTYVGYTETDQDAIIAILLTSARTWVENYSGMSALAKSYQIFFTPFDGIDDWYTIPIGPVTSITSVTIDSETLTSGEWEERGLTEKHIKLEGVPETGVTIEYLAGVSDSVDALKTAIMRIAANLFLNKRDVTEISEAKVDFTTRALLKSIMV